jgi:membrane peptidoglycan carboxypeptidase
VCTSAIPIVLGIVLLATSIFLGIFAGWSQNQVVDESLLPVGKKLPVFFDINGNKMEYKSDNFLSKDEIPDNLKHAFVALEDKRFYIHNGYDLYRIFGALIKNLKSGRVVEGASTITQQLIKNTHLTFERTLSRKAKEIALATKLEQAYSKDEILSMYLSVIYFGSGAYGVKSASKLYFDKEVSSLTLEECATLAGIIKNPTKYSPTKNPDASTKRRNQVLSVMHKEGYIDKDQMESACSIPLTTKSSSNTSSKFYIEMAINEVCEKLNITKYQLDNSGYKIYTNYNPEIQKILSKNEHLSNNFSSHDVESSSIVVDNQSGQILAYNSSLGYEINGRCGSTIKPLVVYAPALENNLISLATPIDDTPVSYGGWTPQNYHGKNVGISNPRDGIKQSSNTVAVKVASYVGEGAMVDFGKKFGLNLIDEDKNLTLALGATKGGQTPKSIAGAYSALSRNGEYICPSFIRFVTKNNQKIYTTAQDKTKVISNATAFLLNDCLIDTAKTGTAKTLSSLPFSLASKTGTVQDTENSSINTDAWNVSYNNKFTIAVWHGGKMSETGGGHPTLHARSIWQQLHGLYKDEPFDFKQFVPSNIVQLPIDIYSTRSNMIATLCSQHTPQKYSKMEYFSASNLPNMDNSLFEQCNLDLDLYVQKGTENSVVISFVSQDVYNYVLTRTDLFGQKQVLSIDGKQNETISTRDVPISFGQPVIYSLKAYVKGTNHCVGSVSKSVVF